MRGTDVRLDHVDVTFGDFQAISDVSLEVEPGEFFSILGPSGCGKTTLLRLISGFQEPTRGRVLIGGADMAGRGPNRRPTALIFQNLALFPLMSVRENVAFGLEARGIPKRERLARADALLALVALEGQGAKKPGELSGGQRQRVAIARALAVEPAVLLLDEPLSALDLKLRQHMRAELKAIQRKTGVTFIYITHDQGEALTMSDRIAVMNRGRVEQVGRPEELYAEPATPFVATFVGEQNVLIGTVAASAPGEAAVDTPLGRLVGRTANGAPAVGSRAFVMIRPERLRLSDGAALAGVVSRRDLEGPFFVLHVESGDTRLVAHVPNSGAIPEPGARVALAVDPADMLILPEGETARA
ncbi:ABC transporter ATP-binding protein [Chelatococcus sp. SYSU_G07232]|uniref:ABC transporter ATP-binding protein n=1 Tax=Chelatococcus albus TaxID=3047466 RepID=A0ABT7AJT5_9HYPH|nr:ABC transporter ATP-binding protein [Chelatococcus sp. SYSU_G07232]MDJ1159247.1 ABC transporter ATP-binding protein [Chelatococcus sp. SYSU_G07232]